MIKEYRLTASQPAISASMDFNPVAISIRNPTPSPIYIAVGQPNPPTQDGADILVGAAQSIVLPVSTITPDFGIAFADATALVSGTGLSGLFRVATIAFLDQDEKIPTFGAVQYANLSLSSVRGFQPFSAGYIGNTYFDLNAWGGLRLLVIADSTSGQGIAQIEVTDTDPNSASPNWKIYNQTAFWPSIPLSMLIPRTTRYVRIWLNGAGIAGDAPIAGSAAVRFSMEEISHLAATQSTNALVKSVAIASLSQQTFIYCTVGLQAIIARWNIDVGTRGEMVWYVASNPSGPWALLAYREQSVQGFYNSITRTFGQLDAYLRVDLLDINGGGITGGMIMTIQQAPETTSYLQGIFGALGDTGQPVNVGQSIYHQQALYNPQFLSWLTDIDAWLGQIDTRVDGVEGLITSTNSLISTTNATLSTINTNVDQVESKLDTLIAQPNFGVQVIAINPTVATSNVWQSVGALLTPGWFIVSVMLGYQIKTVLPDDFFIQLAHGTGGAPIGAFYGTTGSQPELGVAPLPLSAPKAGGFIIPASMTNLWILASGAPAFVSLNIVVRAP